MTTQKLAIFILLACVILLCFQPNTNAQEHEITDFKSTIEKVRLPIPPQKGKKSKDYSLNDEVANLISEVAKQLNLYDIIVGIYMDSTSENQDSTITDKMIVNLKQIERFSEAIVVTATDIFQQGVPPEQDEAYFSIKDQIFKKDLQESNQQYSKNIQTQLTVYAQIIHIKTGDLLGSLNLEVLHTGGSLKKSKAKAMKLLKKKAIYELKSIYWFSTDLITTKNGMTGLPFGTSSGIKKGMLFELIEPDRIWTLDDEEFLAPGGSAGIATVVDTSADSCGLRILRQWRDLYSGSWAVEHPKKIFAIQLNFLPPSIDSYTNFGVYFQGRPLHEFDWGFGMQIMQVNDSFGDNDYGFGFGGYGIWRFFNMSRIDLGGKLGIDLDIPFRKDDDERTVNTALFSAHIGLVAEFFLSARSDFVISAGYRFGVKSKNWEYSEDEETYSAYWENGSPEVDNSGLMFSIGYKHLLF